MLHHDVQHWLVIKGLRLCSQMNSPGHCIQPIYLVVRRPKLSGTFYVVHSPFSFRLLQTLQLQQVYCPISYPTDLPAPHHGIRSNPSGPETASQHNQRKRPSRIGNSRCRLHFTQLLQSRPPTYHAMVRDVATLRANSNLRNFRQCRPTLGQQRFYRSGCLWFGWKCCCFWKYDI